MELELDLDWMTGETHESAALSALDRPVRRRHSDRRRRRHHLWLQALNAFERDEAAHDAQMARTRLAMALREDGDERQKIEARFELVGRQQFIENLAGAKADAQFPVLSARLEDDPEWREKIEIIRRTDFANNASTSEQERQLVAKLMAEWSAELERRIDDEIEFQKQRYADAGDDDSAARLRRGLHGPSRRRRRSGRVLPDRDLVCHPLLRGHPQRGRHPRPCRVQRPQRARLHHQG
jgi:hypothetical protein